MNSEINISYMKLYFYVVLLVNIGSCSLIFLSEHKGALRYGIAVPHPHVQQCNVHQHEDGNEIPINFSLFNLASRVLMSYVAM